MAFNINEFSTRGKEIVEWLEREFSGVRTGRATPALLDLVHVESYGAKVPLQQVGSVSVEDARTLRVSVWDQATIKEVERAINEADLGVSVSADGSGVRVIFPELTSERREQLLKIAKAKLEDARVSLRGARDEAIKSFDNKEKTGDMTDDEKFDAKEKIQKEIDAFNRKFEEHYNRKEAEINQ